MARSTAMQSDRAARRLEERRASMALGLDGVGREHLLEVLTGLAPDDHNPVFCDHCTQAARKLLVIKAAENGR